MDPIVLLVPLADKTLLTTRDPVDTLVSIILVVVILTVVIVPPMNKSPDRLILAPLYVVTETRVELIVLKVPTVELIDPVVIEVDISVPMLALVVLRLLSVLLLA